MKKRFVSEKCHVSANVTDAVNKDVKRTSALLGRQ